MWRPSRACHVDEEGAKEAGGQPLVFVEEFDVKEVAGVLAVCRRVQFAAVQIFECDNGHFSETETVLYRFTDGHQCWLVHGATCDRRRLDLNDGAALADNYARVIVAATCGALHLRVRHRLHYVREDDVECGVDLRQTCRPVFDR